MVSAHDNFMQEALRLARTALREGEFPVGCVLVSRGNVVASGRREKSGWNNEMEHAEILALRDLYSRFPQDLPPDLILYSTLEPCLMCFSTLLLNGVRTIVYGVEDVMGGGCALDLTTLPPLYSSMQVTIIPQILRSSSLQVLQEFFRQECSGYLRGTLLCQWALQQNVQEDK